MSITTVFLLLVIGVAIGFISGLVGIGGGVLVIPVLIYLFGFSQMQANGTSLAMLLPPIGIFGVLAYWKAGYVRLDFSALLAVGFAVGVYAGARLVSAGLVNAGIIRIIFAVLLLYIAGRILIRPGGQVSVALELYAIASAFGITYVLMRLAGRKWRTAPPQWLAARGNKGAAQIESDFEI